MAPPKRGRYDAAGPLQARLELLIDVPIYEFRPDAFLKQHGLLSSSSSCPSSFATRSSNNDHSGPTIEHITALGPCRTSVLLQCHLSDANKLQRAYQEGRRYTHHGIPTNVQVVRSSILNTSLKLPIIAEAKPRNRHQSWGSYLAKPAAQKLPDSYNYGDGESEEAPLLRLSSSDNHRGIGAVLDVLGESILDLFEAFVQRSNNKAVFEEDEVAIDEDNNDSSSSGEETEEDDDDDGGKDADEDRKSSGRKAARQRHTPGWGHKGGDDKEDEIRRGKDRACKKPPRGSRRSTHRQLPLEHYMRTQSTKSSLVADLLSLHDAACILARLHQRQLVFNIAPSVHTISLALLQLTSRHQVTLVTSHSLRNIRQVATTSSGRHRLYGISRRAWILRMWSSLTARALAALRPSTLLFPHLCFVCVVLLQDFLLIRGGGGGGGGPPPEVMTHDLSARSNNEEADEGAMEATTAGGARLGSPPPPPLGGDGVVMMELGAAQGEEGGVTRALLLQTFQKYKVFGEGDDGKVQLRDLRSVFGEAGCVAPASSDLWRWAMSQDTSLSRDSCWYISRRDLVSFIEAHPLMRSSMSPPIPPPSPALPASSSGPADPTISEVPVVDRDGQPTPDSSPPIDLPSLAPAEPTTLEPTAQKQEIEQEDWYGPSAQGQEEAGAGAPVQGSSSSKRPARPQTVPPPASHQHRSGAGRTLSDKSTTSVTGTTLTEEAAGATTINTTTTTRKIPERKGIPCMCDKPAVEVQKTDKKPTTKEAAPAPPTAAPPDKAKRASGGKQRPVPHSLTAVSNPGATSVAEPGEKSQGPQQLQPVLDTGDKGLEVVASVRQQHEEAAPEPPAPSSIEPPAEATTAEPTSSSHHNSNNNASALAPLHSPSRKASPRPPAQAATPALPSSSPPRDTSLAAPTADAMGGGGDASVPAPSSPPPQSLETIPLRLKWVSPTASSPAIGVGHQDLQHIPKSGQQPLTAAASSPSRRVSTPPPLSPRQSALQPLATSCELGTHPSASSRDTHKEEGPTDNMQSSQSSKPDPGDNLQLPVEKPPRPSLRSPPHKSPSSPRHLEALKTAEPPMEKTTTTTTAGGHHPQSPPSATTITPGILPAPSPRHPSSSSPPTSPGQQPPSRQGHDDHHQHHQQQSPSRDTDRDVGVGVKLAALGAPSSPSEQGNAVLPTSTTAASESQLPPSLLKKTPPSSPRPLVRVEEGGEGGSPRVQTVVPLSPACQQGPKQQQDHPQQKSPTLDKLSPKKITEEERGEKQQEEGGVMGAATAVAAGGSHPPAPQPIKPPMTRSGGGGKERVVDATSRPAQQVVGAEVTPMAKTGMRQQPQGKAAEVEAQTETPLKVQPTTGKADGQQQHSAPAQPQQLVTSTTDGKTKSAPHDAKDVAVLLKGGELQNEGASSAAAAVVPSAPGVSGGSMKPLDTARAPSTTSEKGRQGDDDDDDRYAGVVAEAKGADESPRGGSSKGGTGERGADVAKGVAPTRMASEGGAREADDDEEEEQSRAGSKQGGGRAQSTMEGKHEMSASSTAVATRRSSGPPTSPAAEKAERTEVKASASSSLSSKPTPPSSSPTPTGPRTPTPPTTTITASTTSSRSGGGGGGLLLPSRPGESGAGGGRGGVTRGRRLSG